jgi:thymidine phosphorylase
VLDHAVGVQMLVGPGESVEVGQTLAIVHASDDWLAGRAEELLGDAWVITGA